MAGITRCFVLIKSPIRGFSEFSSKVFWHRVLSPYLKLHDVLSLVFHSTWISNRTFTSLTWHTQKQNVKYSQKNSSCSEWCGVALATNYFQRISDGVKCGMICNWSICFLSVACLFLVPWFSSLNIILLRCTSTNEYSLKSYLESEQLKAETENFKSGDAENRMSCWVSFGAMTTSRLETVSWSLHANFYTEYSWEAQTI